MDPKQVQAALDAIEAGDAAKALEILKGLIASAAGGAAPAEASEPLAEGADPAAAQPGDEKTEQAAMAKTIADLTATVEKLTAKVEGFEGVAAAHQESELVERRDLVASLVKLGSETPATAWEGEAKDRKPVERLAKEPIAALRKRVEVMKASKPGRKDPEPPTTVTADEGLEQLSAVEQDAASKIKDPEQRARFVSLRLSRKVNTNG